MNLAIIHIQKNISTKYNAVVTSLTKRQTELQNRLQNLVIMRADGEINSEQMQNIKAIAENNLYEIESELRHINKKTINWVDIVDDYLTLKITLIMEALMRKRPCYKHLAPT